MHYILNLYIVNEDLFLYVLHIIIKKLHPDISAPLAAV